MNTALLNSSSHYLRIVFIILVYSLLQACSTNAVIAENGHQPAMNTLESLGVPADTVYAIDIYDPWENINRRTYNLNAKLDFYVLIPVTNAYKAYIPRFLRQGINNVYSNLTTVHHTINSALQLNTKATVNNSMRLISNTTIGIAGIFDVATEMGFPEINKDFGMVLGYWGIGEGPYIVLPFFGPSNLRDASGLVADSFIADSYLKGLGMNGGTNADVWTISYYGLQGVDLRAHTNFRYYDSLTPFEYEMIRMMYTAQRRIVIGE